MRRDQRRRLARRLAVLDAAERDEAATRWGWLAEAADRARHIDRATPSGRAWFRAHGHERDGVRRLAAMARDRRAGGTARDLAIASLFSKMAGVLFRLRKPATD